MGGFVGVVPRVCIRSLFWGCPIDLRQCANKVKQAGGLVGRREGVGGGSDVVWFSHTV